MSFKVTHVGIADDGRLLVTLKNEATGTQTQIWTTPPSPVNDLTIAQIEKLAKQEAAKEFSC
ncbi:hypothetical protein ACQKO7_18970 [Pseudomonas putida]|uniref:hypothetical protein n=1 Tax=Pseudomonas putida TaxID=303 RepID=UPI003D04D9C3